MAVEKFKLPSGNLISVEVSPSASPRSTPPGANVKALTVPDLDPNEVVAPLAELVDGALSKLLSLARKPDEIGFTVGIKLGVSGGFIIASGTAEANIEVSLKYTRPPQG